jgi:hypothetical protein
MHEIILCKLGEVVLKGLNRHSFESKLMSNIRRRTNRFGRFKVYSRQSTIYVEPMEDGIDMDAACDACAKVFGIIAIARAMPCEKTKEAIFENARTYLGQALTEAGIAWAHEVPLAPRCRIDFLCGGVGIEVKRGKPERARVREQLRRYAGSGQIAALVLVTERQIDLPDSLCGKPLAAVCLNRLWGIAL